MGPMRSLGVSLLFLVLAVSCVACGGAKWTSADATNATDSMNLQLQMEVICGREDAGPTCQPAAVRALERASFCATASELSRHGVAVPDAGAIRCAP